MEIVIIIISIILIWNLLLALFDNEDINLKKFKEKIKDMSDIDLKFLKMLIDKELKNRNNNKKINKNE